MAEAAPRAAGPSVGLTFISTGTVRIRQSMKGQPITTKTVILRRLTSLMDRQWTEELPIGVFIVSHPDGPILFDTGDSPLWGTPGYLPAWSPTKFFSHVTIGPDDGILSQLRAHDVDPTTLQAIVLSHLHGDHAGGLKDLAAAAPNVPVFVSGEHWEAFGKHPLRAKIEGCTPQHWPVGFDPKILPFADGPVGPWKQSHKVTADGKVVVIHTPGHVPGHISMIVYGQEGDSSTTYFLPGDATYGIDLLDREEPDGINDDPVTALQSLKLIKEFAGQTDVVVLPSHDPETPRLLKERVVYKPKDSTTSTK
ncbi:putative beta-lactamase-like protein [Phaeoacremonium minimum UCRPA7]|uniref:Putative beta-lactamase-like protein n=1 Tax=Phaeoacremonium minimum (strain UCR-PA7) TaxID=1286976 RepID=R8BI08_PHAM7|nr:putative beta-lactamase-like protein [Phaeoacremonium minimum UCRPA7]EON98975.1 putative beta-lactamase-like protein [Phaeoacremonium minimum UCRPA7]